MIWLLCAAVLGAGALVAGLLARGGGDDPEPRAVAAPADAAVAADAGAPLPIATPLAATLEIASDPPGATAYVDGEAIGPTPARLESIEPGVIEVRLELDGYQVLSAKKRIREGYSETFFGALARSASSRRGRVKRGGARQRRPKPQREDTAPAPEQAAPPPAKPRPKKPRPAGKPNPFVH